MKLNKSLKFTSNKHLLGVIAAANLTLVLGALALVPRGAHGEFNFEALWNQVQEQQQQINNHEARLNNTEKDTAALQQNTATAPAADHVEVPTAPKTVTPAPAPTPSPVVQPASAPAPVTFVKSEQFGPTDWHGDNNTVLATCTMRDYYSDGSFKDRQEGYHSGGGIGGYTFCSVR